jgi:hypothetical protein
MIFIGGIGRVISMLSLGNPSTPFIIFTLLELLFPLLILWQNKLSPGEFGRGQTKDYLTYKRGVQ